MSRSLAEAEAARRRGELRPRTCIAVDWSGALAGERSRLWVAEARGGRVAQLSCGLGRDAVVRELIRRAEGEPRLVVGLDFAFAFPAWFVRRSRCASGSEFWDVVARRGESWLARCPPPFWGKPGCPRPLSLDGEREWRVTESETIDVAGIRPKSVFQIGGAGSVGTGSLRGMPYLRALRDAGFAIWPFDPPRLPMVVEIYPRLLTGPVNKASPVARALYLQAHHAQEDPTILARAASSEDAFDAAVSAACMQRFRRDFPALLRRKRTEADRVEGRIWKPIRDPVFERW